MRAVFLAIILSLYAHSASLINYSIYKRDTHTDVLLSFNEPYNQQLKIMRAKGYQAVVLPGLISSEKRAINLNLPYVDELLIYPFEKNQETSTVLEFKTTHNVKITPSITKDDGFALRIRLSSDELKPSEQIKPSKSIEFASNEGVGFMIWLKMIIALIIILVILLALKIYLKKRPRKYAPSSYAQAAAKAVGAKSSEALILCEKPLDEHNRFVVLEYEGARYKLIIGQGNIWLNAPSAPTPASENFEQYFLENQQRLSNLIRQRNMAEYKEKISNKKETM